MWGVSKGAVICERKWTLPEPVGKGVPSLPNPPLPHRASMTDSQFTANRQRPERCLLSLPANVERFWASAAQSDADTVMLDLEDAVAPEQKEAGRAMAVQACNQVDWGRRTLSVRINALDTPWAYRDLTAVAEQCPRLDTVMMPKVERPEEVVAVEIWLRGIELATGRERPIGIEAQIESALGLTRAEAIAAAASRLESISFGPGDYAASLGNTAPVIGGPDPDNAVLTFPDEEGRRETHWNDAWHYAMARIAVACRANGVRAIDGPYVDYNDSEGFRAAALRARSLGYSGKWAIHPTQIALANEVFTPSEEEIAHARRLLQAMEAAHRAGSGAITLDGQMIDMAHVRQAERIVALAGRMGGGGEASEKSD